MATAGSDRQSLAPRGDDSAPTPLTGGRTLRALPQNASRPPPRAHSEQGPALPVLETGPSPSSPSVPLLSREHIRLPVDSSPPPVEPPSPFFPLQSAHRPKIISWSPKSGATNHRSYRSNRYLTYTILVVFMILLLPSPKRSWSPGDGRLFGLPFPQSGTPSIQLALSVLRNIHPPPPPPLTPSLSAPVRRPGPRELRAGARHFRSVGSARPPVEDGRRFHALPPLRSQGSVHR